MKKELKTIFGFLAAASFVVLGPCIMALILGASIGPNPVVGDLPITGSVTVSSGTMSLTGTSTIAGSVSITGTPTVSGAMSITGTPTVSGAMSITGTPTVGGTVALSGTSAVSLGGSPQVNDYGLPYPVVGSATNVLVSSSAASNLAANTCSRVMLSSTSAFYVTTGTVSNAGPYVGAGQVLTVSCSNTSLLYVWGTVTNQTIGWLYQR